MTRYIILLTLLGFLGLPNITLAHQKTNFENKSSSDKFEIQKPEMTQAIYGELKDAPLKIYFKSGENIELYLSLLTEDSKNKNFSLELYGPNKQLFGVLDGESYTWTEYNADFDGKNYFQGPEFRRNVASGEFYVKIYNPTNTGKFVLLIGTNNKISLTEGYYSLARISNHAIFGSNYAKPWGLLVVVVGFSIVIILVLLYLRKRRDKVI